MSFLLHAGKLISLYKQREEEEEEEKIGAAALSSSLQMLRHSKSICKY